MSTKVKFVIFEGELIALFPNEIYSRSNPDLIMSYQKIGQHGGASKSLMRCKAADKNQYSELLKELIGQGYNDLIVINKK